MNRFLILLSFFLISSCELSDDNSKSYQVEEIEDLYNEIIKLSESVTCTNSADWKITPMGNKACGGPAQYIAFHQSIETEFLDLASQYSKLQAEYNKKNNSVSDCSLIVAPRSVICEGGKAVLIY